MAPGSYITDEMLRFGTAFTHTNDVQAATLTPDAINDAMRMLHNKIYDPNVKAWKWDEAPDLAPPQLSIDHEKEDREKRERLMGMWPQQTAEEALKERERQIELEKMFVKIAPDDIKCDFGVKIMPNECDPTGVSPEPKFVDKRFKKQDKLDGYYKALLKYYKIIYPDIANNLDCMYDWDNMEPKEAVEFIKEKAKEAKPTHSGFLSSIVSFYETAYPELYAECRVECEGSTIDVFVDTIKQKLKDKRPAHI